MATLVLLALIGATPEELVTRICEVQPKRLVAEERRFARIQKQIKSGSLTETRAALVNQLKASRKQIATLKKQLEQVDQIRAGEIPVPTEWVESYFVKPGALRVAQVVGETEFLASREYVARVNVTGRIGGDGYDVVSGQLTYYRGFPTVGMIDDKRTDVDAWSYPDGTTTYTTVLGSSNTVPVVQCLTVAEYDTLYEALTGVKPPKPIKTK